MIIINYLRILGALISLKSNWLPIMLNKVISLPINYIKLGNGVRFKVEKNKIGKADISMLSETWYYEYYNPVFMKINENDIVFDIGANNGFFTVYAGLKARSGRIIAFEPVKELFEKIRANIKLNKLTNVSVENVAVSNKNTFEKFFISKEHNGFHSMFRRNDSDEQIEVKNLKLENYCLEKNIDHIDFLKLDCEGAEYDIILNLTIGFISKIKRISLEYHDNITNHKHEEIADFLKKNNFIVDCKSGFLYAVNKNYQ